MAALTLLAPRRYLRRLLYAIGSLFGALPRDKHLPPGGLRFAEVVA